MNNIKPCPFCGGKSRVHLYLGKWYARCNKCKTYSAPYDTEEQAAEAWDRRAGENEPVKHGRWKLRCYGDYPYCSSCNNEPKGREITLFCPNCGARMDGDIDG